MNTEDIQFSGHHGDRLSGTLHRADEPRGSILLAHCFTCSSDLRVNVRVANRLAERGYHVLRFDFTGLGRSQGDFRDSTFRANVGDLVRAATWMIDDGVAPSGIAGHSLGGSAALIAATRIRTIASVAVMNAPSSADHILNHISVEDQQTAEEEGCTQVELAGRRFPISDEFLADLDAYDSEGSIGSLGLPIAVIHSTDDRVVPISEGERIFALAAQPKMFMPVIGGGHLLADESAAHFAADTMADWFDATGAGDFG